MPSGQGAAEVDRRIGAARSAFVRLKRSLWGRREISTATKGRIYQAMVQMILLYGCETWPLRAVDLRKLEVFDNDCLRYILRCHLFHPPCSSAVSNGSGTQLDVQRVSSSTMYFSPPLFLTGENVSMGSWRRRPALSNSQVVRLRRWNRDRLAISCDLAKDQRTLAAMVRDAVLAQEEAGSTRPGWKPIQVKSLLWLDLGLNPGLPDHWRTLNSLGRKERQVWRSELWHTCFILMWWEGWVRGVLRSSCFGDTIVEYTSI